MDRNALDYTYTAHIAELEAEAIKLRSSNEQFELRQIELEAQLAVRERTSQFHKSNHLAAEKQLDAAEKTITRVADIRDSYGRVIPSIVAAIGEGES